MWPEAATYEEDYIAMIRQTAEADFIPWEKLNGRTVLMTGATGLIGYNMLRLLKEACELHGLSVAVTALVRDPEAASERLSLFMNDIARGERTQSAGRSGGLTLILKKADLAKLENVPPADYIIHAATPTSGKTFTEKPVETICPATGAAMALLDDACQNGCKGFLYLSSMEIYGQRFERERLTEESAIISYPQKIRSSYPVSKLFCETLCGAYASEYGVPAMSIRLAQTFGPGAAGTDSRLSSYMAECVRDRKPIILRTEGQSAWPYLFSTDAASACLCVLLKGEGGQAYNAADEALFDTIAGMAGRIAKAGGITVDFDIKKTEESYAPTTVYDLDTTQLKQLGWRPLFAFEK